MLKVLSMIALTVASASALAVVEVPYNQWTPLPYCGGQTRLICDDVSYARQSNRCHIEFSNSYGCSQVELYTAENYYPKATTVSSDMQGSFYVDDSKINHSWYSTPNFRVYLHNPSKTVYDQIHYRFDY